MNNLIRIVLLALYLLPAPSLFSQIEDPEQEFEQIRLLSYSGEHERALERILPLLEAYPSNGDYLFYAAHLYFWNSQPDSSLRYLNLAMDQGYTGEDVQRLKTSIFIDLGRYPDALKTAREGQLSYPDSRNAFLFMEAVALERMNENNAALEVLDQIDRSDQFHRKAGLYLRSTILKQQKNTVMTGYQNVSFSQPGFAPLHFFQLEYRRKEEKIAYVGRVNYTHAFQSDAVQGEVDLYPKLGKKSYLYFNLGGSDGRSTFPLLRVGGEYFREEHNLSVSLGGRYFQFQSTQIGLITGHLSYNPGSWRMGYRPYVAVEKSTWTASHVVQVRHTFPSQEDYLQLDLQYGSTPYYYWTSNDLSRTNAYRIGVSAQLRIGDNFFLTPAFMYEREEYVPGLQRNRFNSQLLLSKRF